MQHDDSRRDRRKAMPEYSQVQRAQIPAPGKVTRTSKLPGGHAPAVQRQAAVPAAPARASTALSSDLFMDMAHRGLAALSGPVQARGDIAADPAAVHRAASAGVSGAGRSLPYAERIQASFGPANDVSSVQAHVGGAAAEASERIGAEAYATGDHLAFRSQPDLHEAAHEAAHAVQQRQGVALAGGVGEAGDAYERHADAVADRVVRGESAEALLAGVGADVAAPAVQRRESPEGAEAAGAGSEGAAGAGAEDAAGADVAAPAVQQSALTALLGRIGDSPAALRSALAADPALADRAPALVAEGAEGARLNALMARAFPAQAAAPGAASDAEKDPTDATIPLPANRPGNKKLAKGTMKWDLKAVNHSKAHVEVDFKPDAAKVQASSVSFVQTVISKLGTKLSYAGTTDADPVGKKTEYAPYEDPTSKKRVDHFAGAENDPFYGAEWDQSAGKWVKETTAWAVGSAKGTASTSAKMTDAPSKSPIRIGHGDFSIKFETVPTVLETREPLGSLAWGWTCKDEENAPIVLTGGQAADCKDTPSADVDKAQDQFFAAKFEAILDGFAAGKSALTSAHKGQLDSVVTRMKARAALKVQLGGAADLAEARPADVSLARATAAKTYLTSKGIDAARIEVQSYGASWARVKTTSGKDEPKNRRVQVWVR